MYLCMYLCAYSCYHGPDVSPGSSGGGRRKLDDNDEDNIPRGGSCLNRSGEVWMDGWVDERVDGWMGE